MTLPTIVKFNPAPDGSTESVEIEGIKFVRESGDAAPNPLTSESIYALDLSVRANNCLEAYKICSLADLVNCNEKQLLKIHSFGCVSLREVKDALRRRGLYLTGSGSTSPP